MRLVIHKLIRVIRDYAVISCEIDAHKSHLFDWLTPKLKTLPGQHEVNAFLCSSAALKILQHENSHFNMKFLI